MPQRIINILFSIIIVMLTGVVLYLTLGNKSTPVVEPIPTPVKTTVKPAVVATDETADWKTYTDTNFSYSFKYPPMYTTKVIGSEVQVYASPDTNDGQWIVNFSGETTDTMLSSLVKTKTDEKVLSEAISTTINGLPAYEGINQGMVSWYSVLVKNNSILIQITFGNTDKGSFIQNKSALTSIQKQILSTFKFTK